MTSQNRLAPGCKKKKKFVAHKIPRYLPGSVQNSVLVQDLIEYNKHLYKIFSAQKKVDDNPPNLDISMQLNRTTLSHDSHRLIEIARDNRLLLIRINKINKSKGKIDSYNADAYNTKSRWKSRENEMRILEMHNREFYRRLQQVVSVFANRLYSKEIDHAIRTASKFLRLYSKEIDHALKRPSRFLRSVLVGPFFADSRIKKSNYDFKDVEKDWQNTVEKLKHTCRYPLLILQKKPTLDALLSRQPSISNGLARAKTHFYCFMEFYVPKHKLNLGRIIIELYQDLAPVTVQNFMSICKGEHGLTYEKCQIHNIVRGQCIETGDITLGNGKGGASIYGESFYEESPILQHTRMGVVSMIRKGENQNDSKFCITLDKMEKFNEKRVVFGKVVKGNRTLTAIESLGRKIGKPPMAIIISKCGEYKK